MSAVHGVGGGRGEGVEVVLTILLWFVEVHDAFLSFLLIMYPLWFLDDENGRMVKRLRYFSSGKISSKEDTTPIDARKTFSIRKNI